MKIYKHIVSILILIMFPILCFGQQSGTYKDPWGNILGSWSENDNRTSYQDTWGNSQGFSYRNDNQEDYYDQWGNSEGSKSGNSDKNR